MEQKEQNRIIRMIAAKVTGKDLSPEEEGVLQEWLAEREEHREVYEWVKQGDGVAKIILQNFFNHHVFILKMVLHQH